MKFSWVNVQLFAFWCALLSIALFPFLFQGRLFIDSDSTLQFLPFLFSYHHFLNEGVSFLWNSTMLLGFPTYASQSAGYLDPLTWALFHLPPFEAYNIRLVFDLLLAMVLSYAAGRELDRSRLASLMIGMGYVIAFNWRYLSNVMLMNSLFLMPLLVWGTLRFFRSERKWERVAWSLFLGTGIGWSFLAGNAQFTVQGTFLWTCFFAWCFFFGTGLWRDWRAYIRFGAYGASVLCIAALIALPQILPTQSFTPLTVRAEGVAYEAAVYKVTEPGDVILFLFPDYLYFPYVSGGRKPLYIGALLFLLAIIGIHEAMRKRALLDVQAQRVVTTMRGFLVLFGFTFVASLKWSPIFYLMLKLPIFELFRFPYRWMYLGIWFLCVLGAYGFDELRARAHALRSTWFPFAVATVGGSFALLIGTLNVLGDSVWHACARFLTALFSFTVYGNGPFTKPLEHYSEAFERGITAWREFTSLSDSTFAIPFSILLIACALLVAFVRGYMPFERFRIAAFGLSVFTFLTVFIVQWPYSVPREVTTAHSTFLSQAATNDDLARYRTYPFMLSDSISEFMPPTFRLSWDKIVAIAEMQFTAGWPNMHVFDTRVRSVDGYDVFAPVDIINAYSMMGSTHTGGDAQASRTDEEKKKLLYQHLDVIGMLSGKYIISGVPLSHRALTEKATTTASHLGGVLRIYENSYALPQWYFAESVESFPHRGLTELVLDQKARNFSKHAYLDCSPCEDTGRSARTDFIERIGTRPDMFSFTTRIAHPRALVVMESFLPHWDATIDGIPTPIVRANGVGMAIIVPAGEHTVVIRYAGVQKEAAWYRALGILD